MQVFKAFMKISKKRLNAALIYFGIYAIISLLLSTLSQDSFNENFQTSQLEIAITDEDDSVASHALYDYLASIHNVSTPSSPDSADILDRIYYRTLKYALTIPAGFEEQLLSGSTSGLVSSLSIPGSNSHEYVDSQITQYLQTIQLCLAGGDSLADAIAHTGEEIDRLPAVEVASFVGENTSKNASVYYFFQYFPYLFLAILFAGMAPILVTLNGRDMKARTACSALPDRVRTLSMALGCLFYSLGMWLLFLLLGLVFYREKMLQAGIGYAMLNSLVFLLFAAALALLVSMFSPDDNTLNMLANIIGLSMSFLCGVFVPQSMLADSVLTVGRFLPAYWYIRANNMLAGFGKEVFDLGFYWKCIGIQLLFSIAVFALTAVAAKQRRR